MINKIENDQEACMCALCIQNTESSYEFVKIAKESTKIEKSFVASVPILSQPVISNMTENVSSSETELKSEPGINKHEAIMTISSLCSKMTFYDTLFP